jgi:transposase
VLAELIDEGAGEDRAVAAVRAFNGAAFDAGLAARAVPVLAERPGRAVLAEPDDREILALPERFGPAAGVRPERWRCGRARATAVPAAAGVIAGVVAPLSPGRVTGRGRVLLSGCRWAWFLSRCR